MATEIVQTLSDGSAHYRQTTPLDGVNFVLRFDFNTRSGDWHLTVNDADDQRISGCGSRKLAVGYPVLQRSKSPDRPAGGLFVIGTGIDPGLNDLGARIVLSYETDLP